MHWQYWRDHANESASMHRIHNKGNDWDPILKGFVMAPASKDALRFHRSSCITLVWCWWCPLLPTGNAANAHCIEKNNGSVSSFEWKSQVIHLHLLFSHQIVRSTLIQQCTLLRILSRNATNFLHRLARNCWLENHRHTRQDKHQSNAPPACTDASSTQRALDEAFKLSVHAGDATEHEICLLEGQHRWSVVIDVIVKGQSAMN